MTQQLTFLQCHTDRPHQAQAAGVSVKDAKKALKSIAKAKEIHLTLSTALSHNTMQSLYDVVSVYKSHSFKDDEQSARLLDECKKRLRPLFEKVRHV